MLNTDQVLIKIIFIVLFLGLAIFVVVPGRSVRGKALQRISWLLVILLAVLAVAMPDLTTRVANLLGIGRGTDLLFYAQTVVLIGYMLLATSHRVQSERAITQLARRVALLETELREQGTLTGPATRVIADTAPGLEVMVTSSESGSCPCPGP